MYKISKELFEAVVQEDFNMVQGEFIYFGIRNTKDSARMSINDFFFECKEWALKQGYNLVSCINKCHIQKKQVSMDMHIQTVMGDSEQQAVFSACERHICRSQGEKIIEWTKNNK